MTKLISIIFPAITATPVQQPKKKTAKERLKEELDKLEKCIQDEKANKSKPQFLYGRVRP